MVATHTVYTSTGKRINETKRASYNFCNSLGIIPDRIYKKFAIFMHSHAQLQLDEVIDRYSKM